MHKLFKNLEDDHDAIRTFLKRIVYDTETSEQRKEIFAQLMILLKAHIKAEEAAVYAPAKNIKNSEIQFLTLDAYQEHHDIEEIIRKIEMAEESSVWNSNVKILQDLLNQHFDEEEFEYFPELHGYFSKMAMDRAAERYLKIRSESLPEALRAEDSWAAPGA